MPDTGGVSRSRERPSGPRAPTSKPLLSSDWPSIRTAVASTGGRHPRPDPG
jgi:hypothetical protein